jgi:hypothetical protein
MSMLNTLTNKLICASLLTMLAVPQICLATVHFVNLPDEGGLKTIGLELDKDYTVSSIQVDLGGITDSDVLQSIAVQHPEAYLSFLNIAPAHVAFLAPDFTSDLGYQQGVLVKWHFKNTADVSHLSYSILGYPSNFDATAGVNPPLDQQGPSTDGAGTVPEPSSALIAMIGCVGLMFAAGRSRRGRGRAAVRT